MSDRLKTDVLIVGSGPAGSTVAKYAAEKGVQVTFIERRPEVGVPVRCGEYLPEVSEIRTMFPNAVDLEGTFELPEEMKLLRTHAIRLINPKGKATDIPMEGFTIDRDRYDQYLAGLAVESGAELIKKCQFKRIEDGVAVTTQGEIEYKVIVGADGPGSRVAQSLGLQRNKHPYPAVTAQAKGDFEPVVTMFFGGIAPGAYSWIIPKKGQANVGVGFSPKFADGSLSEYFDIFAKKNNFEIMNKLEGKYVPSEGPIPKTVSGNGVVVGDAAGHVISVNGGGIPLARIAGRICGDVVSDNVLNGRPLTDYETEWRRVMEKPLKTAAFNKKLADRFAFSGPEWMVTFCMGVLGKRRMNNLIRCKRIFP
ncbi:MAG: NAD(P)/FAD-dependent oxidoreductase [Candidatus Methanomethylophilaceae archaeon]|nr:NAD(P)/FAD-dependent oxidoreductase [Candidatus Methanomethylophilaceae archaeon]